MATQIQLRRDTAASWTSANPTLANGEIGYETDTGKIKIGTGSTVWNSLSYFVGNIPGTTLDAIGDVTITSVANGDFLRWNGSVWVNDAVNLSTDTIGSYVESLVAGTGITLSNNSGEGATPTVAIGQAVETSSSVTFAQVSAPIVGNVTGNVTGNLTGNASTATTLENSRAISLAGDLSGSASFNGSSDITITATVQPNSVALGSDTTGNFVSDVTGGTGVIVTHTPGEGSSPTIAIGQAVGTSASVTFATVNAELIGNASTASTLQTARTIALGGDLSGSTSFDGSGNVTITATVEPNSVTLGTDTTGDYVSSLVAGTGVTLTNNSGENATPTVAIGQAVGTSSSVTFAAVTAPVIGNASTATTLQTARAINISGDVSGSVSFDGSSDVTISATVQPNSVALGTDTTGNYMADVTAGTGVTVTHTPGEGSSATIAIPQSVATSASPTFAAVSLTATPTATTHAATKAYVDDIAAGINYHDAVELATAAVLPNSPTYNNGTSGVGATLTAGSNARLVVDGANATTGDRILVKNQATATQNGIYDVTEQGSVSVAYVLTRSADFDGDNDDVVQGDALFVANGATNVNQGFILTSKGTGTANKHVFGTDSLTFTQFTGAANITAGTGLSKTGNSLSIDSTVVTLSDAQTLTNKTLTSPTITGVSPVITLGGDLTGSVTLTNLGSATLTATVAANSVALGTDTTGNYMSNVSAGTGINVSHTQGEGSTATVSLNATLDDLSNVTAPSPSDGQFLKYVSASTAWIPAAIPTINNLDDVGDVAITSATSGDYLKWNGTAWVNDPINLGTDTTGNYMADVTAGTGVTVTHTPGEGSSATIAIGQSVATNANPSFAGATLDAVQIGITAANEIDTTSGNLILDSTAGTVQIDDNVLATGTVTARAASTQDSVILQGRAGGTSSYGVTLTPTTLTGSRTLTLPDTAGTVVTTGDTGTVTSTMIADGTIVNADINSAAAISLSKLASGTSGQVIVANSSGVPAFATISGDIAIDSTGAATIQANSVALGTDTTGNYVASLVAGTGVTLSNNSGEGATPTVAIGQAVGTTAAVTFGSVTSTSATGRVANLTDAGGSISIGRIDNVSSTPYIDFNSGATTVDYDVRLQGSGGNGTAGNGTLTITGNTVVTGDLTINGTTTTVNTATLNVSDNIVILNNDVTGTPTENAGIEVERGTSANVLVRWNETNDKWEVTNDGTTYGNVITSADTGTVTSTMIVDGTIVNADINASAAIALSKIASGTSGQVVLANASGVPTYTTLSGDVTIDSSGVTTIAANSVALGTDTTGNYVASLVAGTGVTLTNNTGEGATPTVAIGQAVATSSNVQFANVTATGLLTVGTTAGAEGGEIQFKPASTGNSLSGNITMDIYQNKLRIFEQGGSNRGVYVDLSTATTSVGTNLSDEVVTNAQVASYTLVLTDKAKLVEMNNASANNLTVPLNSSVAFPVGTQINILQTGAGQTTVVATGGVTINATPGLKLRGQWSYATLIKRATDTWVLVGDISA